MNPSQRLRQRFCSALLLGTGAAAMTGSPEADAQLTTDTMMPYPGLVAPGLNGYDLRSLTIETLASVRSFSETRPLLVRREDALLNALSPTEDDTACPPAITIPVFRDSGTTVDIWGYEVKSEYLSRVHGEPVCLYLVQPYAVPVMIRGRPLMQESRSILAPAIRTTAWVRRAQS